MPSETDNEDEIEMFDIQSVHNCLPPLNNNLDN